MMARRWRIAMVALFAAIGLAGRASAEELSVPGSGNPEYVLDRLAEAFNAAQRGHRVTVPPSIGTAGALRDIASGTATLARVGRPLKEAERTNGAVFVPVGRDPVVFVAGAGVTVRSITSDQVLAIYRGSVTDWQQLGGTSAPIRPIGREVTDASRSAMSGHIKPFSDMAFADNVKLVHLDFQEIELLDRFASSFGFLNRSALSACKTKVVILALDGIEPSTENVSAGKYPVFLDFGLIYMPGKLTPAGEAFLAFIRSPAGLRILKDHGIIAAGEKTG